MSTIGDPLADLGWMLTYWSDPVDTELRRSVVSSMEWDIGYYKRREMSARYELKSNRPMRDFAFYQVFSFIQTSDHPSRKLLGSIQRAGRRSSVRDIRSART